MQYKIAIVKQEEADIIEFLSMLVQRNNSRWFYFGEWWKNGSQAMPNVLSGDAFAVQIAEFLKQNSTCMIFVHDAEDHELLGAITWAGLEGAIWKMGQEDAKGMNPGVANSYENLVDYSYSPTDVDTWFQVAVLGEVKYS